MPQRYEPSAPLSRLLLVLILLVAAALRLPGLGEQSLWYDEAATWSQVNGSFADVFSRTAADNYPPLYNILAWVSVQWFGDAEWALRLPSALLGLLNVAFLYGVGARMGGRTVGLLAALLLTLAPYHVWYSQEARMYALLAVATTAHAWATLHFVDKPRWPGAVLLALTGSVLLYTHPYGALNWIALGAAAVWILTARRDWRALLRLGGSALAAALVFLPWALILLGRAKTIVEQGFWLDEPTLNSVILQFRSVTGTNTLFLPLIAVLAALLLFRRKAAASPTPGTIPLLAAWLLLPTILGVLASFLIQPVFADRYIIGSLPAFLLVVPLVLLAPVRSQLGVVVVSVLCLAGGVATLMGRPPAFRDDWRGMAAQVQSDMTTGDCVAIILPFHVVALDYYLPGTSRCLLSGVSTAAVQAVPPNSRIFLLANQVSEQRQRAEVAEIERVRPLSAHYPFPGSDLYVFDRLPRATADDSP